MSEDTMSGPAHERPRTAQGRFVIGEDSAERDAQAIRLRAQGWSFPAISDRLGYGSEGNVRRAIKRAKLAVIQPPTQELIQQELDQLDYLIDEALAVLQKDHVTVSHGRVILMGDKPEDGEPDTREPLLDDGPKLQAITSLKGLLESRRKLMGLDAAVKVDQTVTEVPLDPRVASLVRSAQESAQAAEDAIKGSS